MDTSAGYNADLLAMISGILLAVLFEYLPGLRQWYDAKKDDVQRGIMLLALMAVSLVIYALSCSGWLEMIWPGLSVTCDEKGVALLIRTFVLALVANQPTYLVLPRGNKIDG